MQFQGERGFFDSVLGWGAARGNSSWPKRAQSWYTDKSKSLVLYTVEHTAVLDIPVEGMDTLRTIPVWLSSLDFSTVPEYPPQHILEEACKQSNLCQEITIAGYGLGTGTSAFIVHTNPTFQIKNESKTMNKAIQIPTAFNAAIEQNKEALQLAAKLSVGKTANAFLVDALTAKLPWYAKMFGQKQALKDNPLTKVATAQLANLLAQHFAQGNTKVTYVADAMLQEAMVDLITNADIVNDLITKLGSFAGDLTGEIK